MPAENPLHTSANDEREIGIELEFSGISLKEAASLVQSAYGGEVKRITNAVYEVRETELGKFRVELDAIPIQKLAERQKNREDTGGLKGAGFVDTVAVEIEKKLSETGADLVPLEIVTPPFPAAKLHQLETLCSSLREKGAEGTSDSIQYAFGLHLNPEVIELSETYILRHIQSFLLLQPWLVREHKVDVSRRVLSFVDPFSKNYMDLALKESYQPDIQRMIKDYHSHNPTRNRALDMLPLFAHMEEEYVRGLYGHDEKIHKRPTFHYRLPNCDIGNPDWSLEKEWNIWLKVEMVARDSRMLLKLIDAWQQHHKKWLSREIEWMDCIDSHIRKA